MVGRVHTQVTHSLPLKPHYANHFRACRAGRATAFSLRKGSARSGTCLCVPRPSTDRVHACGTVAEPRRKKRDKLVRSKQCPQREQHSTGGVTYLSAPITSEKCGSPRKLAALPPRACRNTISLLLLSAISAQVLRDSVHACVYLQTRVCHGGTTLEIKTTAKSSRNPGDRSPAGESANRGGTPRNHGLSANSGRHCDASCIKLEGSAPSHARVCRKRKKVTHTLSCGRRSVRPYVHG